MAKNNYEDELEKFVQREEGINNSNNQEHNNFAPTDDSISVKENLKRQAANYNANRSSVREEQEEIHENIKRNSEKLGLGFINVPIETLPTQGLFYPEGTKLYIRAASGREISHWSMTNEEELNEVDDALNYILERCLTMTIPGRPGSSYKDLKEIDRFYLILSIRDLTFPEGSNELQITISEGKNIPVKKDNIKFITLSENLMKHYNSQEKCFKFNTKNSRVKILNIYMPSVGVSQWLKSYVQRKSQRREGFDRDFITIAPMLIKDYRDLNDASYEKFITSCYDWGVYEYSLIAKIKKIMEDSISPEITYIDEGGAEQTSPLNFRGGIKSIFLLNLEDDL